VNRRRFLRLSLGGSALLFAAGVLGRHLGGYSVPELTRNKLVAFSLKEYAIFRAVAARIVDGAGDSAPTADELEVALRVDAYVSQMPPPIRGDISALLQLLEHSSAIFSRFTALSPEAQDAALRAWESSRLDVRRQGFQALRSLAFMGYWRHDRTWPLIGYTGPIKK
jgi:hypothetical protein